jgi:AcrR family transcriptional regulator
MSPRPRKVSDEEVFMATLRAMSRVGPGDLTLAEIADEAGLTPGALVQRFGSKRALLLALAGQHAGSSEDFIRGLHTTCGSGVAALREYAACMSHMAASPAALARNLAYLQIDLTDPDFRRHLTVQARATRAGIGWLIETAVQEGDLAAETDADMLARTIEAVLAGSMMTWAYYREGTAAAWMRVDLDAILAPHLTNGAARRRSRRPRSR